jgi:hypothetical protein
MSETIAVLITIVVSFVIQLLKPEWFIGWLLTFLNRKLPNNANKIENSLGQKLIDTGVYVLSNNEDNEKIKEALDQIRLHNKTISDELKNLL